MKHLFLFLLLIIGCRTTKKPEIKSNNEIKVDSMVLDTLSNNNVLSYQYEEKVAMSANPNYIKVQLTPAPETPKENKVRVIVINNVAVHSEHMVDGNVVYQIPDTMLVRNTYTVFARIGKTRVNIYEEINGTVRQASIPISETMEVKLIDESPSDNKMFDITMNNNGVQLVDTDNTYTEWSWSVTPKRNGVSQLKIVISIIKNGNKKDLVYSDNVLVRINPRKQIGFFFKTYWQWLLSTIIIPFIVWLYKRRKKKEEE